MHYIHYTKEFEEQIEPENRKDKILIKIQNLVEIEHISSVKNISKYKNILVYRHYYNNNARIIIQEKNITKDNKEYSVLFVRKFISSKSFEYQWNGYILPLLEQDKWLKTYPLEEQEINKFKDSIDQLANKKEIPLPVLPNNLSQWLSQFKFNIFFQIYEKEEWVTYSQDRVAGLMDMNILNFRILIKKIFNNEINDPNVKIETLDENKSIYKITDEIYHVGLIYYDLKIKNKKVILIACGANTAKQKQRWDDYLLQYSSKKNNLKFETEIEISQNSFRAYPKWIIDNPDDEFWSSIQRYDGSHNLSLLPEQVTFLNNIQFPTYINGQAGSGKSTMLYYLFANIILHKAMNDIEDEVIFLTENNNLIEHTFKQVKKLLLSTPEFSSIISATDVSHYKKYFSSFNQYIINLIPEATNNDFEKSKFIDFAKFKENPPTIMAL